LTGTAGAATFRADRDPTAPDLPAGRLAHARNRAIFSFPRTIQATEVPMPLDKLRELREYGPPRRTIGLSDEVISRFARRDPSLGRAIDEAVARHRQLRSEFDDLLRLDEPSQIEAIQRDFVNFYATDAVNPYVALAARGPWIVSSMGAVIHDSGGYGMLGLGHAPDGPLEAMDRPHVMANIMTANYSQLRFARLLEREVGHTRTNGCPFRSFICLNSGSEAIGLAARVSDINAKLQTDPGAAHEGRTIKLLGLKGAFHGRTHRPAQFSDSTRASYEAHLASFRGRDNLITVAPNDPGQLREAFERADRKGWFVEAIFLEPVMGEGNPGLAVTREFYDAARQVSLEHGCLLVVDSIQAGLRAHGTLSIVDYPGFEDAMPPDIEAYSKALNAGQYPLSVLAMTDRAATLYRTGVYGNTMTTNPRALEVACAVLEAVTPQLRANVRERGKELRDKLGALADELDGAITAVQGTGLLLSAALSDGYKSHGEGSVEERMRIDGIGVIHGGRNSLRYTPHFAITSEEIDLIVEGTRAALLASAPVGKKA
jgi:acetylornithine/succinyldiaminopimelate/putrescine aminotransferase